MPMVYKAANLVEAQLIVDELKAGGMQASVTGGYLSGAIGELPPTEVIGVWLAEAAHTERARAIISEFEANRRKPSNDWYCSACSEPVGREFGACWNCGTSRPFDSANDTD